MVPSSTMRGSAVPVTSSIGVLRITWSQPIPKDLSGVRYLLLDPELAPRFKGYLQAIARGERYDPERLRTALGLSWNDLERGFSGWLRS